MKGQWFTVEYRSIPRLQEKILQSNIYYKILSVHTRIFFHISLSKHRYSSSILLHHDGIRSISLRPGLYRKCNTVLFYIRL